MMMVKSLKMNVIKLYMKMLKRQEFRLSLKNLSQVNFNADVTMIRNDTLIGQIDFIFYPNQLTLNTNISTTFLMTVKSSAKDDEDIANK